MTRELEENTYGTENETEESYIDTVVDPEESAVSEVRKNQKLSSLIDKFLAKFEPVEQSKPEIAFF